MRPPTVRSPSSVVAHDADGRGASRHRTRHHRRNRRRTRTRPPCPHSTDPTGRSTTTRSGCPHPPTPARRTSPTGRRSGPRPSPCTWWHRDPRPGRGHPPCECRRRSSHTTPTPWSSRHRTPPPSPQSKPNSNPPVVSALDGSVSSTTRSSCPRSPIAGALNVATGATLRTDTVAVYSRSPRRPCRGSWRPRRGSRIIGRARTPVTAPKAP